MNRLLLILSICMSITGCRKPELNGACDDTNDCSLSQTCQSGWCTDQPCGTNALCAAGLCSEACREGAACYQELCSALDDIPPEHRPDASEPDGALPALDAGPDGRPPDIDGAPDGALPHDAAPDMRDGAPDADGFVTDSGMDGSNDAAPDADADVDVDAADPCQDFETEELECGQGVCHTTVMTVCGEDTECVPGEPESEFDDTCDGRDNDCDGMIDEDFDNAETACGQGACTNDGVLICANAQQRDTCRPLEVESPEECNGIDDDCDGNIDEDFDGAEEVCGQGICAHTITTCQDGQPGVCDPLMGASIEVCNGFDDDCNGTIDDLERGECICEPEALQPCYLGPEGTSGVGICRPGQQRCVDGGRSWNNPECADQVIPTEELCNNTDDNCNHEIDETFPLGEECNVGVGTCARRGVHICNPDDPSGTICDVDPGEPVDELCNNLDDDCDGSVDEDFDLEADCRVGIGACVREGTRICRDDREVCSATPGEPAEEEHCNGIDDDCDGATDEGFEVGLECTSGIGACQTVGVFECGPEGGVTCDAVPEEPTEEVCNGIDDDCNELIDELIDGAECVCNVEDVQDCYEGPDGTFGIGACQPGFRACTDGGRRWGLCEGQVVPTEEVCNGVDDNCDGVTDVLADGTPCVCIPGTEQPCYNGPQGTAGIGQCQGGMRTCIDGGLAWSECVGEVLPEDELCDDQDNDCDGRIDEELIRSCYPGPEGTEGVGVCRAGREFCNAGEWGQCLDYQVPTEDICDTQDNDCDGETDEGTISCGIGACFREMPACADGEQQECIPNPAGEEVCNGEDDDCDGNIDEFVVGQPCDTPTVTLCEVPEGQCNTFFISACEDGVPTCSVVNRPAGRDCGLNGSGDRIDNDCDGQTDEDCGPGQCNGGTRDCSIGQNGQCVPGRKVCDQGRFGPCRPL